MSRVVEGAQADHNCMDHRERIVGEGTDLLMEWCTFCGRLRHETDGVRPMAWHRDPANPTGYRYAYQPSRNDPDAPTIWKFPVAPTPDTTRDTAP